MRQPADLAVRSRVRLVDAPFALAEDVQCRETRAGCDEGFSPDYQVCFPYQGLFVWHASDVEVVGDPNQVLFVTGGEPYALSQPRRGAYAELVVTPSEATLDELVQPTGARPAKHPVFRRRSYRASAGVQRLRAQFLHATEADAIWREETLLCLLRLAVQTETRQEEPSARTRRLIARTKEFLQSSLSQPIRLADVARAVGASPAYLTDVFRRVEGVPLHRYLVGLRLSRALLEVPHSDDLTELALDLGFASHSHFSAAFRRAFGCTPSAFRSGAATGHVTRRSGALQPALGAAVPRSCFTERF